jgi:DNA-directed RNA polymerase subunit RPC12/RpoP
MWIYGAEEDSDIFCPKCGCKNKLKMRTNDGEMKRLYRGEII